MGTKVSKFIGINSIEFHRYYKNEKDCYRYIAQIKWEGKNFKCKKCGNTNYCKGVKPYSRRCTKCKNDESPTSGTMLDNVKFSLHLAFHIIFRISVRIKGMSTVELSKEFGLRQKTCWDFKWKIQQAMESSKQHPLDGDVHVDEFFIGEKEEDKRGRSHGKKRLVIVAIEKRENGIGRAYAQLIEEASSDEFKPFFHSYINKDAKIYSDEWLGYKPLKKDYPGLEQIPSDDGQNFKELHTHIMNIKSWLRGIHHKCSKEQLQGYLDEFHYRFNRRNNMQTIFHNLMIRLVNRNPVRLSVRKQ